MQLLVLPRPLPRLRAAAASATRIVARASLVR
jgi:hypothetical protein